MPVMKSFRAVGDILQFVRSMPTVRFGSDNSESDMHPSKHSDVSFPFKVPTKLASSIEKLRREVAPQQTCLKSVTLPEFRT